MLSFSWLKKSHFRLLFFNRDLNPTWLNRKLFPMRCRPHRKEAGIGVGVDYPVHTFRSLLWAHPVETPTTEAKFQLRQRLTMNTAQIKEFRIRRENKRSFL